MCVPCTLVLWLPHCWAFVFVRLFVFSHTLCHVPGRGIFKQNSGFPMGTNCVPSWSNLVLCYYEFLSPLLMAMHALLTRFIDGLVHVHPNSHLRDLVQILSGTYPAHLSFEVQALGVFGRFEFLDVFVIGFSDELRDSTKFKPI